MRGHPVERAGRLEKTVARFKDDAHLMRIIDKIVSRIGRRIDETTPMVDARLADGSRVNVIIPPLALDGPMMSIRRFAADPFTSADLVQFGTLTDHLVEPRQRPGSPADRRGQDDALNVISGFCAGDGARRDHEDAAEPS
jgi:pilus assembly protein CpaF